MLLWLLIDLRSNNSFYCFYVFFFNIIIIAKTLSLTFNFFQQLFVETSNVIPVLNIFQIENTADNDDRYLIHFCNALSFEIKQFLFRINQKI